MLDLRNGGFGQKISVPASVVIGHEVLEGFVVEKQADGTAFYINRATGQAAMTGIAPPRFILRCDRHLTQHLGDYV